jgi:hypothetical protein
MSCKIKKEPLSFPGMAHDALPVSAFVFQANLNASPIIVKKKACCAAKEFALRFPGDESGRPHDAFRRRIS